MIRYTESWANSSPVIDKTGSLSQTELKLLMLLEMTLTCDAVYIPELCMGLKCMPLWGHALD